MGNTARPLKHITYWEFPDRFKLVKLITEGGIEYINTNFAFYVPQSSGEEFQHLPLTAL